MIQSEEDGSKKAAWLAKLRRAVGKEAGTVPDIWELTIDLPEVLWARESLGELPEPTAAEKAVHLALTLYALHAHGTENGAHISDGHSIGCAAANLCKVDPDSEKGIKRRFDALATAKAYSGVAVHARNMVQLLKRKDLRMDYSHFARDLFALQFPKPASSVKLRWGEDFHRTIRQQQEEEGENNGKEQ
jgi:CRISPR system Cascade subunit CasB